jgi:hypothetical protein
MHNQSTLIESLSQLVRKIFNGQKSLEDSLKWVKPEQQCFALQELAFELKTKEDQVNNLSILIKRILEKEQQTQTIDFEIDEYQMQFNDLMTATGVCPLCGAVQSKKGGDHSC